ncbi:unnamed protein product [Arctia plantaginis]|uniref:Carboxylesterase type B domain-containing protein n=1 Tax=Arctia plantaginis TaxID=874455 RepID=A0A8S1BCJ8_ARCPL|nr:unnamed protein product [Arctia plantaginis]
MGAYHLSADDEYFRKAFKNILAYGFDVTAKEFKEMEDFVRHFYFGDDPINAKVKRSFCKRNFITNWWNVTGGGTVHGDELGYLFDISFYKDLPISREDQRMINQLTKIWTNFVKFGNPNPQWSELLPVKWNPVTNSEVHYLNIGSQLTPKTRPFHRRTTFWKLFYKTYNHLQIPYPSAKLNLSQSLKKRIVLD